MPTFPFHRRNTSTSVHPLLLSSFFQTLLGIDETIPHSYSSLSSRPLSRRHLQQRPTSLSTSLSSTPSPVAHSNSRQHKHKALGAGLVCWLHAWSFLTAVAIVPTFFYLPPTFHLPFSSFSHSHHLTTTFHSLVSASLLGEYRPKKSSGLSISSSLLYPTTLNPYFHVQYPIRILVNTTNGGPRSPYHTILDQLLEYHPIIIITSLF